MTEAKHNKVVIVGGGPAGAAAAQAMAAKGFHVDLFEAYPHPSKIDRKSSKAYVIALNRRGQQGIRDTTGMDPPGAIVSTSLARHGASGVKIIRHEDQASFIVPRQVLTASLLDQAQASGATVHFQQRLVDIDFDKRIATFESPSSSTAGQNQKIQVPYDLLIGADGSKSKVRSLLEANLSDFHVRTEKDSMEYQVVVLPKAPFPGDFPEGTVHVWNNKEYNAICLGFPLEDKGMLLAVVFPEGKLENFRTTGFEDPMKALLPDVHDRVEIEEQLRNGQISNGGLCVWTSSLGSPEHGIVLLGDSGHGMWPSLGQGANCALESAGVFAKCLRDVSPADATSAWTHDLVQDFQKERHADAVAAVDLTYGGIGTRTSRGRQNAPLSYKLQIGGMMMLHKLSFGVVPKPALLQLMGGTNNLSYSKARMYHFYYEKYFCLGALAAVVSIPLLAWSRRSKR